MWCGPQQRQAGASDVARRLLGDITRTLADYRASGPPNVSIFRCAKLEYETEYADVGDGVVGGAECNNG